MRTKTLLSITALFLIISVFGQKSTMELTFTALNNSQYVPIDSIFIENLTQGGDTTLYAPDTIFVIDYVTGIGENGAGDENTFAVSQNYPNPFKGKTEVNLYLPEKDNIKITVRDIIGRELAHYENTLNLGNHSFAFYSAKEKYYMLTVTGKYANQTIKMLNANSNTIYGEKCKIVYNGARENENYFKSQHEINNFGFDLGDELKYTAYTDVEETEIINAPMSSQSYTFQFDGWTPCPGMSVLTDIDGNTYNTVQIGDQCWMKENLKSTIYQNGTPIPNVTDVTAWENLTTGAYVWYENDISWKGPYGALYNGYATIDTNGLCPTGWHVPTHNEWIALTDFIGGTGSPHGNELKSCMQVNSPLGGSCNTTDHPRWNEINTQYGTDDYGFSGLPGGIRDYNGTFGGIGSTGDWWSSTESYDDGAWDCYLSYSLGSVNVSAYSKPAGFSVRCLRD